MTNIGIVRVRLAIVVCGLMGFVPASALAQSGIVGTIKDASGAVLPGVTVEASSPALIERVRSVVTDDQGLYRIVDLRPGVYAITASLAGFATTMQQGLELPAGFTATQNIVLKVGDLAETVNVSATAPTVDTQDVTKSTTFPQSLMLSLPSASKTPQSLSGFVPGVTGELNTYLLQQKTASIHDNRGAEADTRIAGFSDTGPNTPGGGGSYFYMNPIIAQETNIITGAHPAEFSNSGIVNNVIPKQGANQFSGSAYGTYNGSPLQWSNLSDQLRAQGVTAVSSTTRYQDIAADFGGPVVKDKLWFYGAFRNLNIYRGLANLSVPANPLEWVYVPSTQPAIVRTEVPNYDTRVTFALNEKNKFDVGFDAAPHINFENGTAASTPGSTTSIEAAAQTNTAANNMVQVNWTSPVTSHVYLEAGFGFKTQHSFNTPTQTPVAVSYNTIAAVDQGGLIPGLAIRAANGGYGYSPNTAETYRASASYVTGSNDAKIGFTLKQGLSYAERDHNENVTYTLNDGVPKSLTEYADPLFSANQLNADLGVYAQDQLKLKRTTVNLGLRFDYLRATALAENEPAVPQYGVGPRSFGALGDVPDWKDFSPRLGVVYDLFGDGKTAVKASLSRYVEGDGTNIAANNNPALTAVTSATRTWTDPTAAVTNYVPNCDFTIQTANGQCGAISNVNFGSPNPNATVEDPNVLHGWGKRPYNWETAIGVQRELGPGASVSVDYYRRSYGNFIVTQNTDTVPSNYSSYCITAPADSRLPANVAGQQLCGFTDVNPALFGKVQNFITFASNFGHETEVFNGLDVTSTVRLPKGIQGSGGVSFGSTETNTCFVVNSSADLRFCDVKAPYQANIKAIAVVPMRWGVQGSLALQSVPGPQETATYTATNAQILPSLGRNLAAGANGTASLQLIQPGTLYGVRVNQLDLTFAKTVRVGGTKTLRGSVSVYNLLNSSAVQSVNVGYSPTAAWPGPTTTLDGRFIQLNVQVRF